MEKSRFWRFIIATLIVMVIAQIFHMLDGVISLDFYKDPTYFPLWSKLMMPGEGAPPASFFYLSIGFNFLNSLIFVGVYTVLKNAIPTAKLITKGLLYGFLVFLLAGVSGFLAMVLLLNLPVALISIWTAESLIIYLLSGMAMAKIYK